jgi:hypothetical protein
MANNQPERTESNQASNGGSGVSAGDLNIFSADNAKYFKPLASAAMGGMNPDLHIDDKVLKPLVGAALGGTNAEMHGGKSNFDLYGFLSGMGTTFSVALGAEKGPIGPGIRPSLMLVGLGVTGADALIDHTLFKGVDRKAPSMIADGVSMAIAFTPQPLYMKAAEMVAVHTAGRFIDKLLD